MNNQLKNELIKLYDEQAYNDIDDLVPIINKVKNRPSKVKKPYTKEVKKVINKIKINLE